MTKSRQLATDEIFLSHSISCQYIFTEEASFFFLFQKEVNLR
jgi:hypothetical protein